MSDLYTNSKEPDAPADWEHYARFLRELPEREAPVGQQGRIQERLDARIATGAGSRRWLHRLMVPAMAVATALVVAVVGFGDALFDSTSLIDSKAVVAPMHDTGASVPAPHMRPNATLPAPSTTYSPRLPVESTPPTLPQSGVRMYPGRVPGEQIVTGMPSVLTKEPLPGGTPEPIP